MSKSSIGERGEDLGRRLDREAHLWLMDLEGWQPALAEPLLSEEERLRARRLRHPEAQKNFAAGRALVRSALSRYAPVEPSAWSFRSNRLGRPEISEPASDLRFNLAHTHGLAACVVTSGAGCGVDVEWLERPLRPLRIAEHSFAPGEFADLEGREGEDLARRFFAYWTLKEAYYKARGSGIPFRLTGARFSLERESEIRFLPAASEETRAEAWSFSLFRPKATHLLAVALELAGAAPLELRSFRATESGFEPAGPRAERTTAGDRAGAAP